MQTSPGAANAPGPRRSARSSIGSLFSSEGNLDARFRRAREIFLVFSGVFGTVIGFYFGAGESRLRLGVDATLDAEKAVLAAFATGGTPPYKIDVTYGPKSEAKSATSSSGWATFAFDRTKDLVVPLRVIAIDSRGERGEKAVPTDAAMLRDRGWPVAAGGVPAPPADPPAKPLPPP